MFNIFKKEETEKDNNHPSIMAVACLLIHSARIDENYTDEEKKIVIRSVADLFNINLEEAKKLVADAEKKEQESNQIVEFTKEIKKYSMESRLKIIEVIWKIVYSDGTSDDYESNLIRRICGLLYISDKDNGIIKAKLQNILK